MNPGIRALVRVSAALAAGDAARLEARLREAREAADHAGVEEALLQSYLFLGFPAALRGFSLWRELAPAPPESGPGGGDERARWRERGEEVCRRVYGGQYERLVANVRRLHPELAAWMLEEGYGKVLGRPGLPLPHRELCVVAVLAVTGARAPLHSHLRGALLVGADPADVEETLREAEAVAAPGAAAEAWAVWRAVRSGTERV